jgi:hypothetical protein
LADSGAGGLAAGGFYGGFRPLILRRQFAIAPNVIADSLQARVGVFIAVQQPVDFLN